jgi:demethylmenaquinone methyltransferase/2-methoxy-6-polyprenyl-1,4-benzoquinol methylase
MPLFDHFGWIAPYYDRLASAPDVAFWREALRLPSAGRLLDAGGGTGRISQPLAGAVDAVVLVDTAWKMAAQARLKPKLFPLTAEAEALPFVSESFSRVMMVDALHHVRDPRLCAREMLRVLEPGGRLVILEPDIHRASGKVVALLEKLLLMRSHFLSTQAILTLFANAGVHTQARRVQHQVLVTVDRTEYLV